MSSEEAVLLTVCSTGSTRCVDKECDRFGVQVAIKKIFDGLKEKRIISYHQWIMVEEKVKELKECP